MQKCFFLSNSILDSCHIRQPEFELYKPEKYRLKNYKCDQEKKDLLDENPGQVFNTESSEWT